MKFGLVEVVWAERGGGTRPASAVARGPDLDKSGWGKTGNSKMGEF